MTKEQTVKDIEYAMQYHEQQMFKIEKLLKGIEIDNPTAVPKSQCELGKWIYAKENHLEEILGELFYSKLDNIHGQWHVEYMKIYNIFFKSEKKGFLSSLMGLGKPDLLEVDKAKLYYVELQETTDELIHALESSLRRVNAMNEGKFF